MLTSIAHGPTLVSPSAALRLARRARREAARQDAMAKIRDLLRQVENLKMELFSWQDWYMKLCSASRDALDSQTVQDRLCSALSCNTGGNATAKEEDPGDAFTCQVAVWASDRTGAAATRTGDVFTHHATVGACDTMIGACEETGPDHERHADVFTSHTAVDACAQRCTAEDRLGLGERGLSDTSESLAAERVADDFTYHATNGAYVQTGPASESPTTPSRRAACGPREMMGATQTGGFGDVFTCHTAVSACEKTGMAEGRSGDACTSHAELGACEKKDTAGERPGNALTYPTMFNACGRMDAVAERQEWWSCFLDAPDLCAVAAVSSAHTEVVKTFDARLDADLMDDDELSGSAPEGAGMAEEPATTPVALEAHSGDGDGWHCCLCRCPWRADDEGCGICELPRYMCEDRDSDAQILHVPCGHCGSLISGDGEMPVRVIDKESGRPEWMSLIDLTREPVQPGEMVLCGACWG